MKAGLNILLAILFLMQALGATLILINFEINRDKIAKTLCVKKAEPKNCCKGSCHLKKQLQAEEKKEQAPSNTRKILKEGQLFCEKKLAPEFKPCFLFEVFTPFQANETHPFHLSVFHPPC